MLALAFCYMLTVGLAFGKAVSRVWAKLTFRVYHR